MDMTRREFEALALSAAVTQNAGGQEPWHQRLRRVGQVNFNARDPQELDVELWADYWASAKVDAVLVNVTGMIAFYPTEVPFHRRSPYLGDRDFFGDCCAAAERRGLRVIGRMSPDLQWDDAMEAHPEWFRRDREGNPERAFSGAKGLHHTCMFSPYYTVQVPAIMREINERYPIDGIFTNGWPPFSMPVCYCQSCSGLPERGTLAWHDRCMDRVIELWRLFQKIAQEKSPENVYFGNLGGSIRAGVNLKRLGEVAWWFNADNQGRTGASPAWVCAQQGRVAWSAMKGKTITNVTGAWATGRPLWRNAAKSRAEADLWMAQTVASGMVVWYHWLGAQTGMGEDRRWMEGGRDFLNWHARHEEHFVNRKPIANLGVVLPQRTHTFYKPRAGGSVTDHLDGIYYALIENRFLFDFVHEDDLAAERLKKYDALILPNAALLSDAQCRQLQAYAGAGGSLLATFESGLYDEAGHPRGDFGLAELFGINKAGEYKASRGFENSYYARIERRHPILDGFRDTNWLPGAEQRIPVRAAGESVLTVVPPYPAYPTEVLYSDTPRTTEPAVVLRERGNSRLVYFPGDVDRSFWLSGNPDIGRLLANSVRWLLRGKQPAAVSGEGLVELFAWETGPGLALHILNYNNPNFHRGYIRKHYAIGPLAVRMNVPEDRGVDGVELLRGERGVPFERAGNAITFTVDRVDDYEVAAVRLD